MNPDALQREADELEAQVVKFLEEGIHEDSVGDIGMAEHYLAAQSALIRALREREKDDEALIHQLEEQCQKEYDKAQARIAVLEAENKRLKQELESR